MKEKTCKWCKQKFTPIRPAKICCSPDCEYDYGLKHAAKAEANRALVDRKTIKLKLDSLKTARDWMKEAQAAVNAYVRARDEGKPCISCGRHHQGQWHAGHYRSAGSAPHLRLDADRNIHRQCAPCNTHLSGNLINYRIGLIARIGLQAVEELEADQTPRKYSIEDLKAIKATYTQKLKDLKHGG